MCFWSKYPILGLLHLVHGAVPGIFSPEVTVDSCLPKWSGRTWKQAFCSDLFTVSALEQRFPLKEGLGYLKISCDGSLLWFIFRIAAAFCSVLHTACLFLKECHRRSCFGVPACRPAPLPGAAELWEHGWSVVLCVTAPSDANASSAGKGSFSSLLLRTKGANSERV